MLSLATDLSRILFLDV